MLVGLGEGRKVNAVFVKAASSAGNPKRCVAVHGMKLHSNALKLFNHASAQFEFFMNSFELTLVAVFALCHMEDL